MPLLKPTLETQLRGLFTELSTNQDSADALDKLVSQLATIIDTYIKSATVTVDVTTVGTATTQKGIGTGSLT
jgi:hypothetical protein